MSDDSPKSQQPSKRSLSGNSSPLSDDNDDFWELEDLNEASTEPKKIDEFVDAPIPEEKEPEQKEAIPQASATATSSDLTPKKRFFALGTGLEKILISVFVFILLLGFGLSAKALHKLLPTGQQESFKPNLPLKGQFVTIEGAATYWRRPTEGAADYQIKNEIEIIPAAHIELNPSSNGILRCFFTDDRNQFIGDVITLKVTNGTFEQTGSGNMEIYCTDGFPKISDFAYYQTKAHDKEYRWRIVITEGKDLNTRGDDLKQIAKLPISPMLFSENNK